MESFEALFFLLGMILFFMVLGIPVALAFLAANMIGAAYFMGGNGPIFGSDGSRDRTAGQQRDPDGDQLQPDAGPDVSADGRDLLLHRAWQTRMFTAVDRLMGQLPARLSFVTVAGGTAFRHAVRIIHGIHRPAWVADGARDAETRIQETHGDRPDPWHRRSGHADPTLGAGRAFGHAGQSGHRGAADCRRGAGYSACHLLCGNDPDHGPDRPRSGPVLRS